MSNSSVSPNQAKVFAMGKTFGVRLGFWQPPSKEAIALVESINNQPGIRQDSNDPQYRWFRITDGRSSMALAKEIVAQLTAIGFDVQMGHSIDAAEEELEVGAVEPQVFAQSN